MPSDFADSLAYFNGPDGKTELVIGFDPSCSNSICDDCGQCMACHSGCDAGVHRRIVTYDDRHKFLLAHPEIPKDWACRSSTNSRAGVAAAD